MTSVAALFVETNGVYYGLPGVDPWDVERDARNYRGAYPVVAHPPCQRWSVMGRCRGYYDGKDEGCFESALESLLRCGGVIEHPARTLAWKTFGIEAPPRSGGWIMCADDYWTCEVDQRQYGHEANKPTWLLFRGPKPTELVWGRGAPGKKVGKHYGQGRSHLSARTPLAFRDALLALARSAV